jgi:L-cysteine S-thiosulfotransferase
MTRFLIAAAFSIVALPAFAQQAAIPKADPALVERVVQGLWAKATPEWTVLNTQDETQKICSATKNEPSDADFKKILAREQDTVIYPLDGNVMGDWKKGEQVAQRGTGGQFTDAPGTYQGGNCYACHQMAKSELSYGTLGPSLLNYGKDRKFAADEAKMSYAKIYNAQSVLPCSQMPRFGHAKFLTQEQIKDAVAFLFDKDSPVNK